MPTTHPLGRMPMLWEFALLIQDAGDRAQISLLAGNPRAEARAGLLMDSEEFAAFYGRSARRLWAYLARVSSDPALADDLMQESFVRFLCGAPPQFSLIDGEVAARRYLFRIATNLLRDHWRKPSTSSIEEIPEELFASPDRSAQADAQAMLGVALKQMRPRDRQLLWLAHAEGYSHREIAQITGLASASIRLLLFRARRKLSQILLEKASSFTGLDGVTTATNGFQDASNAQRSK